METSEYATCRVAAERYVGPSVTCWGRAAALRPKTRGSIASPRFLKPLFRCLSRMRGNSHVRFFEGGSLKEPTYPDYTISGNFAFWLGSVSVFFTSYYSFRSLFLTFLAPTNPFKRDICRCHDAPILMAIPLILLAFGSIFVGYLAKV